MFKKKWDREGIAPLFMVGAVVLVLFAGVFVAYLLYTGDQEAKAVWQPGADYDNAKGQVNVRTLIVKDYNGEALAVQDYSEISEVLSVQREGIFDWLNSKLEAAPGETVYRVHYLLSAASGAWHIEQYVTVTEWGTVIGPGGEEYVAAAVATHAGSVFSEENWSGPVNTALPFVYKDGTHFELVTTLEESKDGGEHWYGVDSTTRNIAIEQAQEA